jgi:hypothetical protein
MFSHIIIFASSLPEALGGQALYAIICERVRITLSCGRGAHVSIEESLLPRASAVHDNK